MDKIFLIILFCISQILFSHENKQFTKIYNNVKINTSTAYYSEKINQMLIIGQYAEMLSKKYNFNKNIELNFFETTGSDFLFGYYQKKNIKDSINLGCLNLRFQKYDFDITGCLNIIEFGILNLKKIEKSKEKLSIIYNSKPSNIIIDLLQNKLYRPNEIKELKSISPFDYYFQGDDFFITSIDKNNKEVVIETVNAFLDIYTINKKKIVLFINKEQIEIIDTEKTIDKYLLKIYNSDKFYRPFKIQLLGEDKILFEFNADSFYRNRTMIFFIKKNIFIEDLDELVSNCR